MVAAAVERGVGDGARWGVPVSYSFSSRRPGAASFLRRNPERWRDGLLFLGGPHVSAPAGNEETGGDRERLCYRAGRDRLPRFCANDPAYLAALLEGGPGLTAGCAVHSRNSGVEPALVHTPRDFFDANMRLISRRRARYVTSGYFAADGSCSLPTWSSPLGQTGLSIVIGNDAAGALASVGPQGDCGKPPRQS